MSISIPLIELDPQVCEQCSKPAELTCSGCLVTHFCSYECQKTNWRIHRSVCISIHTYAFKEIPWFGLHKILITESKINTSWIHFYTQNNMSLDDMMSKFQNVNYLMKLVSTDHGHKYINVFRNMYGYTLLHIAALKGSTPLAELLLKKGAYVDSLDYFLRTPLFYACVFSESVANVLIQNGAFILNNNIPGAADNMRFSEIVLKNNKSKQFAKRLKKLEDSHPFCIESKKVIIVDTTYQSDQARYLFQQFGDIKSREFTVIDFIRQPYALNDGKETYGVEILPREDMQLTSIDDIKKAYDDIIIRHRRFNQTVARYNSKETHAKEEFNVVEI